MLKLHSLQVIIRQIFCSRFALARFTNSEGSTFPISTPPPQKKKNFYGQILVTGLCCAVNQGLFFKKVIEDCNIHLVSHLGEKKMAQEPPLFLSRIKVGSTNMKINSIFLVMHSFCTVKLE